MLIDILFNNGEPQSQSSSFSGVDTWMFDNGASGGLPDNGVFRCGAPDGTAYGSILCLLVRLDTQPSLQDLKERTDHPCCRSFPVLIWRCSFHLPHHIGRECIDALSGTTKENKHTDTNHVAVPEPGTL